MADLISGILTGIAQPLRKHSWLVPEVLIPHFLLWSREPWHLSKVDFSPHSLKGPGEEWHGFGAKVMTNSCCLTCFVYGGRIPALIGSNHPEYISQTTGQTPNMIKSVPIINNKTNGGKEPPLLVSTVQIPSSQP